MKIALTDVNAWIFADDDSALLVLDALGIGRVSAF